MNIGIIGCGVTGGALKSWLLEKTNFQVQAYDPHKGFNDSINHCNYVFICVSADNVGARQDLTQVKDAVKRTNLNSKIFIRSTVLPGTAEKLAKEFKRTIYSMPEFLTERSARLDMFEQPIVIGGVDKNSIIYSDLGKLFPGKQFFTLDNPRDAEMTKYMHNVFLAVKVHIFNILSNVCDDVKADYTNCVHAAANVTGYFSKMHTRVPGPDGEHGFGGKCFPKDLEAFSYWQKTSTAVLSNILQENEELRGG